MSRPFATALLFATIVSAPLVGHADEVPSFLQAGDAFCTSQVDFDDFAANGHVRPNSAIETCQTIIKPTRVAVMGGQGKVKSMVRVMNGPLAYSIGWTNGALPLAK